MNPYLTPRHFARIATVGFIVLIAALAVIQSRRGADLGIIAPLELEVVDALGSELSRCGTITLDDTASLANCRRVWAKNSLQFFGPTKTLPSSLQPKPTTANASGKVQDRVLPVEGERHQSEVR